MEVGDSQGMHDEEEEMRNLVKLYEKETSSRCIQELNAELCDIKERGGKEVKAH